jgi:hypothetical protein
MNEIYVNYLEGYPNLERALKEGANMHCSLSGSGLRVVIVMNGEKEITYGEYPYFSGALAHAEEDFGLTYDQQYGGENAKRTHYLTGSYPLPYDAFDVYLKSGNTFDVFYSEHLERFICSSDINNGRDVIWGSSSGILAAIVDCILSGYFRIEEKEKFMERIHGEDSKKEFYNC